MKKTKSTTPRTDVYARVTDRIIADLEKGVRPWQRPWSAGNAGRSISQPLRASGVPYRGINVMLLWGEAADRGYVSPFWMTYRQAAELGAQVHKGEAGSLVVYAKRVTKTETDDQGEEVEREIPFMKGYLGAWLEVLRADSRAIFTAAAQAQRAADYLHGLQQASAEIAAEQVAA